MFPNEVLKKLARNKDAGKPDQMYDLAVPTGDAQAVANVLAQANVDFDVNQSYSNGVTTYFVMPNEAEHHAAETILRDKFQKSITNKKPIWDEWSEGAEMPDPSEVMTHPLMKTNASRVRIREGSGIDSNKEGEIISWDSPEAMEVRNNYPFVGGRTPESMNWVAIKLESGEVTTQPRNNVSRVKSPGVGSPEFLEYYTKHPQRHSGAAAAPAFFPLSQAYLCGNCEMIGNSSVQCPACQSRALESVENQLGGSVGQVPMGPNAKPKEARKGEKCDKCKKERPCGPEGLCHECWQGEKDAENSKTGARVVRPDSAAHEILRLLQQNGGFMTEKAIRRHDTKYLDKAPGRSGWLSGEGVADKYFSRNFNSNMEILTLNGFVAFVDGQVTLTKKGQQELQRLEPLAGARQERARAERSRFQSIPETEGYDSAVRAPQASTTAGIPDFDKELLIEHLSGLAPETIVEDVQNHFGEGAVKEWALAVARELQGPSQEPDVEAEDKDAAFWKESEPAPHMASDLFKTAVGDVLNQTCPNCENPIKQGEMVNWTSSGSEAHVHCPPHEGGGGSRIMMPSGFKPKPQNNQNQNQMPRTVPPELPGYGQHAASANRTDPEYIATRRLNSGVLPLVKKYDLDLAGPRGFGRVTGDHSMGATKYGDAEWYVRQDFEGKDGKLYSLLPTFSLHSGQGSMDHLTFEQLDAEIGKLEKFKHQDYDPSEHTSSEHHTFVPRANQAENSTCKVCKGKYDAPQHSSGSKMGAKRFGVYDDKFKRMQPGSFGSLNIALAEVQKLEAEKGAPGEERFIAFESRPGINQMTFQFYNQKGEPIDRHFASTLSPEARIAVAKGRKVRLATGERVERSIEKIAFNVKTAKVQVSQGQDEQGFHMLVNLNGTEYVLRGADAEQFRKDYAAIQKPEEKVNALVERYLGKLQRYAPAVKKPPVQTQEDRAKGLQDADNYWAGKGAPEQQADSEAYYEGKGAPKPGQAFRRYTSMTSSLFRTGAADDMCNGSKP